MASPFRPRGPSSLGALCELDERRVGQLSRSLSCPVGRYVREDEMNGPSSAPDDALARELGAIGLL